MLTSDSFQNIPVIVVILLGLVWILGFSLLTSGVIRSKPKVAVTGLLLFNAPMLVAGYYTMLSNL